jgi:hypothetical protein
LIFRLRRVDVALVALCRDDGVDPPRRFDPRAGTFAFLTGRFGFRFALTSL